MRIKAVKGTLMETKLEISDDHNYDFLIGMNILSLGDMALTRVDGIAAFSFRVPPAGRYIEFEKESC